jgi:hypothetical protein
MTIFRSVLKIHTLRCCLLDVINHGEEPRSLKHEHEE